MEQTSKSAIYPDKVFLDQTYIDEKGGVLNALTYASAQYIRTVLKKHIGEANLKRFSQPSKLKRTIIHKNAHLDEYFGELLFRAVLPYHLMDIEVSEHVLMSKEDDTYAKISWTNGVVFGIGADKAGGAKPLAFYDEHNADGTRTKPSCSQLVAEEYLGNKIPWSIQKVLDEVNLNDTNKGAHQFHFAHVIKEIHDILLFVGKDEINQSIVTKYLNENWKRGLIDAALSSMIFVYENKLEQNLLRNANEVLRVTKNSFNYFLKHNLFKFESFYNETVEYYEDKILNINPIVTAKWKVNLKGEELARKERSDQILIVQRVCYSLNACWGNQFENFVMMHIWYVLFQRQMNFYSVQKELELLKSDSIISGEFGSVNKYEVNNNIIKPQASGQRTSFKEDSNILLLVVELTNPAFYNITKPVQNFINNDYELGGNNGFGLFMVHDKIVNSLYINSGATFPKDVFNKIANEIYRREPDKWFLFRPQGGDVEFVLNRTKGHQEQLPTNLIDTNFIIETLKGLR
jgi:hypothetical protein